MNNQKKFINNKVLDYTLSHIPSEELSIEEPNLYQYDSEKLNQGMNNRAFQFKNSVKLDNRFEMNTPRFSDKKLEIPNRNMMMNNEIRTGNTLDLYFDQKQNKKPQKVKSLNDVNNLTFEEFKALKNSLKHNNN